MQYQILLGPPLNTVILFGNKPIILFPWILLSIQQIATYVSQTPVTFMRASDKSDDQSAKQLGYSTLTSRPPREQDIP